MPLPINHQ